MAKVTIDHSNNQAKQQEIIQILNKDNCLDIFRDAFIDFDSDYQQEYANRILQFTKYKFKKKSRSYIYQKIMFISRLGFLKGLLFLRVILKRI